MKPDYALRLALGAAAVLTVLLPGCARDVNDPDLEEPYPVEARMAMRTRGTFDPDTWYYMVFNYTAAPSTAPAQNPIDQISAEDRAAGWERYVAYNRNNDGVETLVTLQRPNFPTLLPTARGPVDISSGDFDGNEIIDIVVACNLDDVVQILLATPTTAINPIFYEDAFDVETADGPGPLRLHCAEMNGTAGDDLLVIYEGDGTTGPFYRLLPSDTENGNFLAGEDVALPAVPVDAVFTDFNGDTLTDFAVITSGAEAADNLLLIYLGAADGTFTQSDSLPIEANPLNVAVGQLDTGGIDIAVSDGGNGSSGTVQVFLAAGAGEFSAGPELTVTGALKSVAIGTMFGSNGDIVIAFDDATGQGAVAVFQNETATPFQTPATGITIGGNPTYVIVTDAGGDSNADAIMVDGGGGTGQTLYIQRGERDAGENIGDPPFFVWNDETITYLLGIGASRIKLADIDGNAVPDLLIPNSADVNGGNSITLCFGLGRYNYTNADVFWTDDLPELLTVQEWYISHNIGPNFFELVVDPALFYDLARLPPDRTRGFNVTFMTGTTGIDAISNEDQLGEIRDFLSAPINVPMRSDFYNDEQNLPLANQNIAGQDSQDIDNWLVEVF